MKKDIGHKARRARILLQSDAAGPGRAARWTAVALDCRVQAVENVRRRCVLGSFPDLELDTGPAGRSTSSPARTCLTGVCAGDWRAWARLESGPPGSRCRRSCRAARSRWGSPGRWPYAPPSCRVRRPKKKYSTTSGAMKARSSSEMAAATVDSPRETKFSTRVGSVWLSLAVRKAASVSSR